MAEPSIAGMRAEGEKLSPDGSKVIFLWNAEGKMPRDLYLVSTSGGDPKKILSPSELPVPSRSPEKENKLDYGLVVRDEFVKERENQLGNFEWSPDSKRLITTYGGDLYLVAVEGQLSRDSKAGWAPVEEAMRDRLSQVRKLLTYIDETVMRSHADVATVKTLHKNLDVSMQAPGSWESQRAIWLSIDRRLESALDRLIASPEFRSDPRLVERTESLEVLRRRIREAREKYESAVGPRYRRLTKTQAPEVGARFLDNERIMFSQGGHLMVWDLKDSMITQVTREANPQSFIGVFGAVPNKPGTMIAYVVSDSSKSKVLVVPNYLDEFVVANNTRRGWTEQKVMVAMADGSRDKSIEIKLPKPDGVSSIRRMAWAADNRSLIVDRIDKDTKRRTLFYVFNVGSKGEKIVPVIEETDDKWQAPLSNIIEPNPKDPSKLFFVSEKDGYAHIYLADVEMAEEQLASAGDSSARVATASGPAPTGKVNVSALTKGDWQVEWAKWSDADRILYMSTQTNSSERQFYQLFPATNMIQPLPVMATFKVSPQIADDDADVRTIIFEGSEWNKPGELMAWSSCNVKCEMKQAVQLTQTTPEAFNQRRWTEPKFLEIPSRDGKKIPAKIYLPANFNPKAKQKYPMVVFVHGAGYLQNVINGWNNYYREFMFNELLVQKGYVVLDIDYRGSAGYGRDWRTGVYDFLGGKDFDDHIDAIDYMVANYSVNPAKVGAYGGSYGGFMAGMLVTRAPDKIAAAAALRPVFDWKNYYAANPGYTAQRLGFPEKNPEAYKRSSPITYADKLERPLLILHGMSDDNVHVQDSIQMMEKLIRLGKTQYFETMLYPSENHGFARPESWTDEYERILAFFEKHLR